MATRISWKHRRQFETTASSYHATNIKKRKQDIRELKYLRLKFSSDKDEIASMLGSVWV